MKECIILAGGLGTRLREAVPDLPKCMAPVAGRPFLSHVIGYFQQEGIERFIFALGYKSEAIETFLQTRYAGLSYQCSREETPLGTGGAIRLACTLAVNRNVLVLNGDTLFKIKLSRLASFHDQLDADCTLTLKPMQQFDRYGVVELAANQSVRSFREKQFYESGYINGGVYALNVTRFMQEALPEKFSFEKDYLEKLYTQRKIYGQVQNEYFIDIGIPADYARAQEELK